MKARVVQYDLDFVKPAVTSRNTFERRTFNYIILEHDGRTGVGEATPLEKLSLDDVPEFTSVMCDAVSNLVAQGGRGQIEYDAFQRFPALLFGLETALADLGHKEDCRIFNTPFTDGAHIQINGLIWMADVDTMLQAAANKIESGFKCIKFKVGAQDFDAECRMLELIRKRWSAFKVEIRLDANGAFLVDEAEKQLKDLRRFDIHSIEQPIGVNQWDDMQRLCARTTIPIALDEELIGLDPNVGGAQLLGNIKPQYIILKPNLIGGFKAADSWINVARKHNIGWWATSALESNIGLNAVAQWVSGKNNPLPQGLGTGSLYKRNIESPLIVEGSSLVYTDKPWNLSKMVREGREILSCG